MIHTKEFCGKKCDKVTKFQGIIFEITIFRQQSLSVSQKYRRILKLIYISL